MATTSIWKVKGSVGKVVRYACNPEKTAMSDFERDAEASLEDVIAYAATPTKTEDRSLVAGINCVPETAADEMRATKRQYGKEGGIVAFHGYQSFAPGETDAKTAHGIGARLAQELWGDRFEVVVATHVDRGHIHNHFVVNSVSFADGKRFHRDAACYRKMREASDRLCAERGLSVIGKSSYGASKHYSEWSAERQGRPTWRALVKADIDEAIAHAATERQFWANLAALGYEVKRGKDISVRPPGKERFVRLARNFGDGYTLAAINGRILANRQALAPARTRQKSKPSVRIPAPRGSLMALYRRWLYLLGGYEKGPTRPHFLVREDIRHMERIADESALLIRESIETQGQLDDYVSRTRETIAALIGERKTIRKAAAARGVQPNESRLAEIAQQLKRLRKEVRMCESIEERSKSLPDRIAEVEAEAKEREGGGRNGSGVTGGRADSADNARGQRDPGQAHGRRR